jgi:oligoendopeptidase F
MSASSNRRGLVWDLSSYFPEFNGTAMREFKERLSKDISDLQTEAVGLGVLGVQNQDLWEELLLKAEDVASRRSHISSYVNNLASADATNEDYPLEIAALATLGAGYAKFEAALLLGLKPCTDEAFEKLLDRPALDGMQYFLKRLRVRAQRTMSQEQERLAADLLVDGFNAWGRLYDNLTGKLEFEMQWPDGRLERLPISQQRGLMAGADRSVGRAAFECGNRAWEGLADVCGQAINSISGTRQTLNSYRGWNHFLDVSLFQSGCSRDTLDAMYSAIYGEIEQIREIFRVKGAYLGQQGISWFEREAPLPLDSDAGHFDWEAGSQLVMEAFQRSYPALATYFAECLENRWIESEPRPGKRPGAYCTGSPVTREQRVYMTYNGTLGDATTLAHELGHAWHSQLLVEMRPVARRYPMPLAETASIFAEHILAQGVHSDPAISDDKKLTMLDEELTSAATIILDIAVRYEFEKALCEERVHGELSISRLKTLMVDTQRRIWGDALQEGGEDPLFWVSKLHFYITDAIFYNYPYTFGWLMARYCATRLVQEGSGFLSQYENFLRLSGSDSVENVVRRAFGQDTTDPDFWRDIIRSLAAPLEQFRTKLAQLKVLTASGTP